MGVDDQSQSAAQPAGKAKPSSQGRRGRSFGPNRRGRGRRPMERPPGAAELEKVAPTSVQQHSVPEPDLPPPIETDRPEVESLTSESEAREMPPMTEEEKAARADEQMDADQQVAPPNPPVIEHRQHEQRPVPAPSRPAPYTRPSSHRPSQPPERRQPPEPSPTREFRPAAPRSVQEAIEDVNEIIETLKTSLEDMEELLETLELAERQKDADEQEIESLRRSLRQLNRPRESGRRDPGHREGGQGEAGHREGGRRDPVHREGGHGETGHREGGHRH